MHKLDASKIQPCVAKGKRPIRKQNQKSSVKKAYGYNAAGPVKEPVIFSSAIKSHVIANET